MNTFALAVLLACQAALGAPQLVGAHRGLSPGQPENTLRAFRNSIASGVDVIEIDLRRTSDGAIVIMHDPTVDRTTNGMGVVSAMSLDAIRKLDAGRKAGAAFAGERVPTYDEVVQLAAMSKVSFLLDIKDGGSLDLVEVVRLARERGAADHIIVGVRRLEDLRKVRAIDPGIRTLAFASKRKDIDAFIAGGVDIVRLWSDWVEEDPGLIDKVHAQGKQAWALVGRTIPADPAQLVALHERLGCTSVDAIVTDTPALLRRKAPAG